MQGYDRDIVPCRFLIGSPRRRTTTILFFVRVSRVSDQVATSPVVFSGTGKEAEHITQDGYCRRPIDYKDYRHSEGKVKSHYQFG